MSYTKVNITKKVDNAGRPVSFASKVVLIDLEDVDISQFPARGDDGVTIAADVILNAGAYAVEMYVTPKTLKINNAGEGDPDKKGYIQHLEFEHPGDEVEFNAFAENSINKNFLAIVSRFDGTNKRLLGTPGCPLQFSDEGQNDSEAVTNVVKFESLLRGPRIAIYDGAIPTIYSEASGSGV